MYYDKKIQTALSVAFLDGVDVRDYNNLTIETVKNFLDMNDKSKFEEIQNIFENRVSSRLANRLDMIPFPEFIELVTLFARNFK